MAARSLEEAMFQFLRDHPDLEGIIGTRVFPLRMPHDTKLPAITFSRISAVREMTHNGNSHLARPRLQFNCWSEDYLEAKELAHKLMNILHGFSGEVDGITIRSVTVDLEFDIFDDATNLYQTLLDATFWHKELIT